MSHKREGWVSVVGLALITSATPAIASPSAGMPPSGDIVHSRIKAGYGVGGTRIHTMTASWIQPTVTCGAIDSGVSLQIGVGERYSGYTTEVNAICRTVTYGTSLAAASVRVNSHPSPSTPKIIYVSGLKSIPGR